MRPDISRLVRWACVLGVAAAVLIAVLRTGPVEPPVAAAGSGPAAGEVGTDFGPLGPADRELLTKVRQAGLWEMPTGQQMQQRASSEIVRDVGGRIATEHAELDAIVRDTAGQLGVDLPSQPTDQQQAWMAEISAQSGADYDRVAVNRLRAAHGKVLPVVAQVRSGTRNELIRDFATTAAEFVTRHHEYLESTGLVDFAALPEPQAPAPAQPAPAQPAPAQPASPVPGSTGQAAYPVANTTPTGSGGTAPSGPAAVGTSTVVSAVVAVGAVLGAGALIGLLMHAGSRRRPLPRPPSRPRPAPPRRPAPWGPPPGQNGGPPYRPRAHRVHAILALALAAGLVASLLAARGPDQPDDVAVVTAAAERATGGGHDHGGAVSGVGSRGTSGGSEQNNGLDVLGRDCTNSDLPPHDGFQKGRRCVSTAFGEVSAAADNPSLLITAAPQKVRPGQPFTMRVSTRNLVRDRFLGAADGGYYLERSELTAQGIERGHFHVACRMLASLDAAPDPAPAPAAFVPVEDGKGGAKPDVVTVEVPGLPRTGVAQCAAWAGDGSHRIPMMERANQTPAFDAVRIAVQ